MLIRMESGAREDHLERVWQLMDGLGLRPTWVRRDGMAAIVTRAGLGKMEELYAEVESLPGVDSVVPLPEPYKLVSRRLHPQGSAIRIAPDLAVGGAQFVIMAGPCTVESETQLLTTAHAVHRAGARVLRGGAFKPRTSPYSFQGLGEEGLRLLAKARRETGLAIITEVMATEHVDEVCEVADILQVGARNMQNYFLLRRLGSVRKPVLLKRGLSATIEEWLLAAEYIVSEGNPDVILCERGIRTFEEKMRNTLDLGGVALVRELSHLPVIVDPSQATGVRSLVPPLCRAAVAVGADGLLVEVHPHPERALVDGAQSLSIDDFEAMMRSLGAHVAAAGRRMESASSARRSA